MISKISCGIKVSVENFFQPEFSNPLNNEFIFAYKITIANQNRYPVKLHRRHWYIIESNGSRREVEGEGVVGIQPTILPGEDYHYVSGCNLSTEMGKMFGAYQMENLDTLEKFDVPIPVFEMIVPFKLN